MNSKMKTEMGSSSTKGETENEMVKMSGEEISDESGCIGEFERKGSDTREPERKGSDTRNKSNFMSVWQVLDVEVCSLLLWVIESETDRRV